MKNILKNHLATLSEVSDTPNKEAEIILLHILQKDRIWLHLNQDKSLSEEDSTKLANLVEKRATGYPLEYITGKASFYSSEFDVCEGVLIPRPETEILVEKAISILKSLNHPRVVEVGVGSGIISTILAREIDDISITAVDINPQALKLAEQNATKFGVNKKIKFIHSDLLREVGSEIFDLCISNPPYIARSYKLPTNVSYEPHNALFGGEIGDELLHSLIKQSSKQSIKYLLCEMGYDQKESLSKILLENGYNTQEFYKDYSGFDRGFVASS
jgi:release factor glutamine methyltransferase